LNLDGDALEIPTTAYAVDTFNAATGVSTFKSIGTCETVNCGRGMSQQQTNVRVAKVFRLGGRANVEAIGEVFNLFNNINPSNFARASSCRRRAPRMRRCCSQRRSRATSVVRNSASADRIQALVLTKAGQGG